MEHSPEEMEKEFHHRLGQAQKNDSSDETKINWRRYRKVRWFFARAFLHIIWWDIIINRPGLRWFRPDPLPRWRKIAARYRRLALEMGGVLIKLGQFLSIRVDVLPPEVTGELAGLQDEIPPEQFEAITAQIEADFDRPISEMFEWISPRAVGSASLAQAHLARLVDGQEVVLKVLRPGIDILVETDLAAIGLAIRWLKIYPRISDRVDLDWLAEEFTSTTRQELDFEQEGRNAERFAADFADDPQVYIPHVYWEYSARWTLTLENVGYIKIGDLQGIEAAGISRAEVARKLYNVYMEQIFVNNFVHADPHPGNLFVKPLPHPETEERAFRPGETVPYQADRPFQLVFVDFGMVAVIPDRLRSSLREYAIGFGTQDAHRVIKSYADAGILLPEADKQRLEEATADMLQRLWGVRMGQVRELAASEARYFLREYRDLVYEAPFQFPVDMLFVMRAIGILSGMATNLDPEFDPWTETIPFAERLAQEEMSRDYGEWLQEFVNLAQILFNFPTRLDRLLTQVERGQLTWQTALAPSARREVRRLEQAVNRLTWMVVAGSLLLAGVNLESHLSGLLLSGLAIVAFLWGMLGDKFFD